MNRVALSKARTEQFVKLTRAIMDHFETSGVTHDGSINDGSSRLLPEVCELIHSTDKEGTVHIYRKMNGQLIELAYTDNKGLTGQQFIDCYSNAAYPIRAAMLGIDNPHRMNADQIRHYLTEGANSTSSYQSTVTLAKVTDQVAAGQDSAGRTRAEWHGHSAFSVARWMGAHGWDSDCAIQAFHTLRIPVSDATVRGGLYAGKKGGRGTPITLSVAQMEILDKAGGRSAKQHAQIREQLDSLPKVSPLPEAPAPAPLQSKFDKKAAKRRTKDDAILAAMKGRKAAGK